MMFWGSKSGISSKYSFSSAPTFTSEPWSVYTGRAKSASSTSGPQRVSIFMFDKKQYENYLMNYGIIKSRNSSSDKQLLQEGYDVLRNQVSNLARLKHPNVLTLIEPLEEHSKNFIFVTEYVTGSLESVFATTDDEQNFLKGHVKEDIIIHRGIFQLVHALDFIHNRTNSVHLDIQPKSIFINDNSDWKVSGLGHLIKIPDGTNTTEYFFAQYDPRIPPFMHLAMDYTAPEVFLDNIVSTKSDLFSLGLLMYMLYSGESLLHSENSTSEYKDEYTKFERKISTLSWENVFIKLPTKLRHCIPMLMNRDIYSRYNNITDFLESEFFQDPMIKTLNFLDDLPTKSNEDKLVFLQGLEELLSNFPVSLLQRKFLAVLLELLNQLCAEREVNSRCVSLNLRLIIKIGTTLSQLSFQERLLPVIINNTNFPVLLNHATVSMIDNLPTLKEKVKQCDFLDVLLKPIIKHVLSAMEGEGAVLPQEKLMNQIPLILDCLDFLSVKKFLLPLISALFTKTTSLKIKIICVQSFQTLIERKTVDTYIVCDEILPLFKSMKSRDPRILLKSLKLFEIIPQIVTDEAILVGQVLPLIWNYSMAETLTTSQYTDYTKVINKISIDVQRLHMDKLHKTKESNDNGREFNRIIETTSSDSFKKETDSDVSKSVNIPTITPSRKPANAATNIEGPTSTLRSTSTTNSTPIMNSTTGMNRPPGRKQSILTPLNQRNTTHNTTSVQGTPIPNDDFVSSRSSPAINKEPYQTAMSSPTMNSQPTQNNTSQAEPGTVPMSAFLNNSMPPRANPVNKHFPPGFSIPLQPNKKNISTVGNNNNSWSSHPMNTSDSLI